MAEPYGFTVIDASRSVEEVQADLRQALSDLLDPTLLAPAGDGTD